MESDRKKVGPPLHGEVPKIRRTITVDPAVWSDAMATAETRDESLSGVIERGLRRYTKRNAPPESASDKD